MVSAIAGKIRAAGPSMPVRCRVRRRSRRSRRRCCSSTSATRPGGAQVRRHPPELAAPARLLGDEHASLRHRPPDIVAFEPGPVATMYTCGITPYDSDPPRSCSGIPHLRDILRRAARPRSRSRDEVRAQHHRRRRLDPGQGPASSVCTTSISRPVRSPVPGRPCRCSTCCPATSEPRATSAIPDIRGFIGMVLDRGFACCRPGERCTST